MGKRSREKRERKEEGEIRPYKEKQTIRPVVICKGIIWLASALILFTPLLISGDFFFPYVGPKSLYFMALAEIIFTAWLILIIFEPKYRPRFNFLLLAIILFLTVSVLSSVFGANFSNSFWSKYERMTGLLMWFHLLAFFVAISSFFKKSADWFKLFGISIFVAILISLISLVVKANPSVTGMLASSRGGATIGNSSFMGTYLLFNIFLALYLVLKSVGWLRIYSGISLAIISLALFSSDARAANIAVLGGVILLVLLWLIFCKKGSLRLAAISLSTLALIGSITFIFFVIQPNNFVYEKAVQVFSKASIDSRLLVWDEAWKGWQDRPWLGWGPENFEIAYTQYFDPRQPAIEGGGEWWFDRTHNIVLDTLVTVGIVGLLSYFGIFLVSFYVLWKKYWRKSIGFLTAGIFSVILISYFVQNLTVFDMINSYLMFFLVLGFVGSIASQKSAGSSGLLPGLANQKFGSLKKLFVAVVLILFCFPFFKFVIRPLRTDAYVIKAMQTIPSQQLIERISQETPEKLNAFLKLNSQQRLELYKKTLETSPLGKYQIREFFGDALINLFFSETAQKIPKENIIEEFDFVSKELEKGIKESPLNYRSCLTLGKIYNAWSGLDATKISQAEKILEKAIELSPQNPQTYWSLAQTKINQRDFETALSLAQKAIDFEPRLLRSHEIAIRIAELSGDKRKIEELAKAALEITLRKIELYPQQMQNYISASELALKLGDKEKAREIAQKAIEINPDWQSEFKKFLEE